MTVAANDALTIHLDAHPWALPLGLVVDVCRSLPVTPVPAAPRHVLGLAAWRGLVIPCIGLRQVCAIGGSTVPEQCLFVVVRLPDGEVGLEVEGPVEVRSTTGEAAEGQQDDAAGAQTAATEEPPLLDLERVLPRYDTTLVRGDTASGSQVTAS